MTVVGKDIVLQDIITFHPTFISLIADYNYSTGLQLITSFSSNSLMTEASFDRKPPVT